MQGKKIKTFLKKLLFFFKKAVILFLKALDLLKTSCHQRQEEYKNRLYQSFDTAVFIFIRLYTTD